jgi:hypothetical protein
VRFDFGASPTIPSSSLTRIRFREPAEALRLAPLIHLLADVPSDPGGRLGDDDTIPSPKAAHEVASFDSPGTTTLQEFSGWGGGIYVEPALKVSFPDVNRDLVLHYVSETASKNGFVVLKDVSRDIFVELHYVVDEATGILGRSAVIMNRTKQPLTMRTGRSGKLEPPKRRRLQPPVPLWTLGGGG